jgi:phosphotransacetylase
MVIGMLWFDNDPKKSLADKVLDAADYYRKKYRAVVNCCYVHPSMIQDGELQVDNVVVKANKSVLPNHLWMGRDIELEVTNAKRNDHGA